MIAEAEAILANQSLLPELGDAASRYWKGSSHPENIEDIKNSAIETFREKPVLLAGFAGLLALESLELSPLNETVLIDVARDHFIETSGEDIRGAAMRVGAITMAVETTIGLGFALYLHKAKDTVQLVHNRYLKKNNHDDIENDESDETFFYVENPEVNSEQLTGNTGVIKKTMKQVADSFKFVGLALLTGAGGATIVDNISDDAPSLKKSSKYAVGSAASIALYDMAIATGIMVGTKSNIPVLKDFCEGFIDIVKNPRVAFLALTGAFGLSRLKERRKMYKKLVKEGRITE